MAICGASTGIVTPDTILRWYRPLVARKYDGSTRRGAGRPRVAAHLAGLVVRLANENPGWGYTRIRDVLHHLGHEIGRSTVKRILLEHGIDPAPERIRTTSGASFLAAHWGAIAAADFLTVEVLTMGGLVRHQVLVVMDLMTRRVEIAGISCEPTGAWMMQVAQNLTDMEVLRLPARSPNLNAYVERFVLSIKTECLGKIVPLGEAEGEVRCRERVGGMLRFYYREAA